MADTDNFLFQRDFHLIVLLSSATEINNQIAEDMPGLCCSHEDILSLTAEIHDNAIALSDVFIR